MKKLFCFFVVLTLVFPAFAEGEQQQAIDKTGVVAAASYVDGAYSAMNTAKQDKLTSTNVVESGSGAVVSAVTANNGTVTVTKSEVMIPVGGQTSSSHAYIWIQ